MEGPEVVGVEVPHGCQADTQEIGEEVVEVGPLGQGRQDPQVDRESDEAHGVELELAAEGRPSPVPPGPQIVEEEVAQDGGFDGDGGRDELEDVRPRRQDEE
jgi:hypothetical protein